MNYYLVKSDCYLLLMLGNYSEIIGGCISLTLKFLKSTKASSHVTINKNFFLLIIYWLYIL
jgi:hypothetical protein